MKGSDEEIRAFIAIDLPAEVKSFLLTVATDLKKTGADVKWARAEGTHLTLKFLGNIATGLIAKLDAHLSPALSPLSPLTLHVRGLGAFPGLARPRVFWVGVESPEDALVQLAHRVDSLVEPLGFIPEKRPFNPHLTLARVRSTKGVGALIDEVRKSMNLSGPMFVADRAVLFQSILKPSGAEYRPLLSFTFSGD